MHNKNYASIKIKTTNYLKWRGRWGHVESEPVNVSSRAGHQQGATVTDVSCGGRRMRWFCWDGGVEKKTLIWTAELNIMETGWQTCSNTFILLTKQQHVLRNQTYVYSQVFARDLLPTIGQIHAKITRRHHTYQTMSVRQKIQVCSCLRQQSAARSNPKKDVGTIAGTA